ncbi:zinc finger protein 180 [Homo sapiens]|uniref:Zinc finger protein 180 n=1 Tax=Homo sapiens TaxID=9606 RepID=K7ES30_HUMAN|nr:zinc finger protein 180 [Homo sapiens]KAI2591597.1 zinc finger protein 180 [Homo sapiens]KAI4043253.1 zinc finger protein 180 [Homo sapiens]KAI4043257.1 zinc finger protein 180 [Homo sapiens]
MRACAGSTREAGSGVQLRTSAPCCAWRRAWKSRMRSPQSPRRSVHRILSFLKRLSSKSREKTLGL